MAASIYGYPVVLPIFDLDVGVKPLGPTMQKPWVVSSQQLVNSRGTGPILTVAAATADALPRLGPRSVVSTICTWWHN